jgi:hypothetical protein
MRVNDPPLNLTVKFCLLSYVTNIGDQMVYVTYMFWCACSVAPTNPAGLPKAPAVLNRTFRLVASHPAPNAARPHTCAPTQQTSTQCQFQTPLAAAHARTSIVPPISGSGSASCPANPPAPTHPTPSRWLLGSSTPWANAMLS